MSEAYEKSNDDSISHSTPASRLANELLRDNNNSSGLLVRCFDALDSKSLWTEAVKAHPSFHLPSSADELHYSPATHLHARQRARNALFALHYNGFCIVIGTRYRQNTMYHGFQDQDNNYSYVQARHFYPHDTGTMNRGVLTNPEMKCNSGHSVTPMCIENDECLSVKDQFEACEVQCTVKPERYGVVASKFLGPQIEKGAATTAMLWYGCWYERPNDVTEASNSLWVERHGWYRNKEEVKGDPMNPQYFGWTECLADNSVRDPAMADSILLPLLQSGRNVSKVSIMPGILEAITENMLQSAFELGYGDLPIVLYRETKGANDEEECQQLWGGRDCEDALRKEIFTQEYNYTGGCLYRPQGCREVYYFPGVQNGTGICSAFTENSVERKKRLCENEKNLNVYAARKKSHLSRTQKGENAVHNLNVAGMRPEKPCLPSLQAQSTCSICVFFALFLVYLVSSRRSSRRSPRRGDKQGLYECFDHARLREEG